MAAARGPHDAGAHRPWPRALGAVGGMAGRFALVVALAAIAARAELPPEVGYVFPAGGRAGEACDVVLGGYDWTTDVEILPYDPGVTIAITGAPTRVLIPEPPHLFGYRARANDRPCPREFPGRLTLPADLPPGLHRFHVANANGVSPAGVFHVSRLPAVVESREGEDTQTLPDLPLVIDGRIGRTEEIDRYRFTLRESGPVSIDLVARRLLSPLHAMIRVVDGRGTLLVDVADTAGRDLTARFDGVAGETYDLSIHDIEYSGDRSSVYRIELSQGPPMAPGDAAPTTASGDAEIALAPPPVALDACFERDSGRGMAAVDLPAGRWRISARASNDAHPLDLDLTVLAPDGRELVAVDDAAGSTDPVATIVVPEAGRHRIVVGARPLVATGVGPATWRVAIDADAEGFEPAPTLAEQVAVPLGGSAKLAVPVARAGGFAGPVAMTVRGLPDGVTVPADAVIAAGAAEGALEITCAADAGTASRMATLVLTGTLGDGRSVVHERPLAVAITMKPRVRIVPDGLDDVRKVHRGTTFRGPLTIHRLEGFTGPVTIHPTAKQQRHRQGMDGGELVVAAGETRCEYPIFLPEWMETTRTSRFIVNGAVEVADPRGRVRTLLERQELRLGMLPEGAIMKLSGPATIQARRGGTVDVGLVLSRAAEFRSPALAGPVRLELVPESLPRAWRGTGVVAAEPVAVAGGGAGESGHVLRVSVADLPQAAGVGSVTFRATAFEEGLWPVVSEATAEMIVE